MPSAVIRSRLHAPQKGELIGAMKPTRPGEPSANAKERAVAEGSSPSIATSGWIASIAARVAAAETHR